MLRIQTLRLKQRSGERKTRFCWHIIKSLLVLPSVSPKETDAPSIRHNFKIF